MPWTKGSEPGKSRGGGESSGGMFCILRTGAWSLTVSETEAEKVSDLCPNRIILATLLRIDERGPGFKQEEQPVGDVAA